MAHTPVAPSRSSWPAFAERPRRSLRSGAIGPAATTRVFELHEILAAGRPLNATTFAREHELSTRTVKRDIERLRDFHHAPIVWDARARSYRYTAPFDLLTGLRLGADEALAVVLAGRTFAAWEGTPLGRTLTATLEKVARFAGAAVSFPAADLRAVLHQEESALDAPELRHFTGLLEDILARRELVIVYQKPAAARAERRTVRPLHLAYLEHRWMLVAEDTAKAEWRNFVLARIQAIERTANRFCPPPTARLKAYLRGSLGRFTGKTEIEVRLRFDATAAPYVRERPWHASQTVRDLPDGGAEATFRLNNLIDVQRRILANGRHVEALAPPELRASVAAEIAALAAAYAVEIAGLKKNLVKNAGGTSGVPPLAID